MKTHEDINIEMKFLAQNQCISNSDEQQDGTSNKTRQTTRKTTSPNDEKHNRQSKFVSANRDIL